MCSFCLQVNYQPSRRVAVPKYRDKYLSTKRGSTDSVFSISSFTEIFAKKMRKNKNNNPTGVSACSSDSNSENSISIDEGVYTQDICHCAVDHKCDQNEEERNKNDDVMNKVVIVDDINDDNTTVHIESSTTHLEEDSAGRE